MVKMTFRFNFSSSTFSFRQILNLVVGDRS